LPKNVTSIHCCADQLRYFLAKASLFIFIF
jgi:hypothetical protein